MARVMLMPKGMAQYEHVYVTDEEVGAGRVNRRDDVLLVQFFLAALSSDLLQSGNRFFNYTNKRGVDFNYTVPNHRPLQVDGTCGNETVAYIKHFQAEASKEAGIKPEFVMVRDGVVSPIRKGQPWGARSDRVLSIVKLNAEYAGMFGKQRLEDITADPFFPAELQAAFYMTF
jgi:hypothetical protein